MKRKPLIVGNWKMKPATLSEAKKLHTAVATHAGTFRNCDIVLCPPAVFLSELRRTTKGKKIQWGVQDCATRREASETGSLSPSQLKSVGAQYVIVGHSERRALGDTNEIVRAKMDAALKEELFCILCIGEHEHDTGGAYLSFIQKQLDSAFSDRPATELERIVIAYEPVWAIGKSAKDANVTPHDVHEMMLLVRKFLADKYGRELSDACTVLYGGSVEESNAASFLEEGYANGLLVGHASVVPSVFLEILSHANTPHRS